jgi:hypothetical protein
MGALRLYLMAFGATGLASLAVAYYLRSRRKTAEQLERERRQRVSTIGRITDGTLVDIQEVPASGNGSTEAQFVIFQYDVAGVSYEASQEITHLQDVFDIRTCKIGLPASVKYDPHNPGNSIVLAENWKGLRA